MENSEFIVENVPSYAALIALVEEYYSVYKNILYQSQLSSLNEVRRRLSRIQKLSEELIVLNNKLVENNEHFHTDLDFINGFKVNIDGQEHIIKLKRKDPNVPIQLVGKAAMSAYSANNNEMEDEQISNMKIEFEEKVESFYQSAHRIKNLVKYLPSLLKFECLEITMVRNKLIEHTDGRHIYSFGFGSYGPVIKPERPQNESEFHDKGLIHNSKTFIESLELKFKEAISHA